MLRIDDLGSATPHHCHSKAHLDLHGQDMECMVIASLVCDGHSFVLKIVDLVRDGNAPLPEAGHRER